MKNKDDKLKELSWEVVEISSLLDQAGLFFHHYDSMTGSREDLRRHNGLKVDLAKYHKGLFKKKRQPAATHILVTMASEDAYSSYYGIRGKEALQTIRPAHPIYPLPHHHKQASVDVRGRNQEENDGDGHEMHW